MLATIKWAVQVQADIFLSELSTIADDIFLGKTNSLVQTDVKHNK